MKHPKFCSQSEAKHSWKGMGTLSLGLFLAMSCFFSANAMLVMWRRGEWARSVLLRRDTRHDGWKWSQVSEVRENLELSPTHFNDQREEVNGSGLKWTEVNKSETNQGPSSPSHPEKQGGRVSEVIWSGLGYSERDGDLKSHPLRQLHHVITNMQERFLVSYRPHEARKR